MTTLDLLPADVIAEIAKFYRNPKDIITLALTKKIFFEALNLERGVTHLQSITFDNRSLVRYLEMGKHDVKAIKFLLLRVQRLRLNVPKSLFYRNTSDFFVLRSFLYNYVLSLENFPNLTHLTMKERPTQNQVLRIADLPKLTRLTASRCGALIEIRDLPNLKRLTVKQCGALTKITGVPKLKNLSVEAFENVNDILKSHRRVLTRLKFVNTGIVDVVKFPMLRRLTLVSCREVRQIVEVPKLIYLHIINCRNIPQQIVTNLIPTLTDFKVKGCRLITTISAPSLMTRLEALGPNPHPNNLWDFDLEKIENFDNLTHLTVGRCPKLIQIINLPALKHLSVSRSTKFTKIEDFPRLTHLELNSIDATELNVGYLPLLSHVTIFHCDNLRKIPISYPQTLTHLTMQGCKSITQLPDLPSLKHLHVHRCPISKIAQLPALTHLNVELCYRLSRISQLQSLTHLRVQLCPKLSTDVKHFVWLTHLQLEGLNKALKFDGALSAITHLSILNCSGFIEIPPFPVLTRLKVEGCSSLHAIKNLPKLTHLEVKRCVSIRNIENLPKLIYFAAIKLFSLGEISQFPALVELKVNDCEHLASVTQLPKLTYLAMKLCNYMSKLVGFPEIVQLSLYKCNSLLQIQDLPKLTVLKIAECHGNIHFIKLPELSYLALFKCYGLTKQGVGTLTKVDELYLDESTNRVKEYVSSGICINKPLWVNPSEDKK